MQAEITDIKINADATKIASSSNDGSIRIWSLEKENLGFPLAVLKARPDRAAGVGTTGASGPSPVLGANRSSSLNERRNASGEVAAQAAPSPVGVTDTNGVHDQNTASQFVINFLDWNPVVPNALAAVSSDGVCRVWDTMFNTDPVELRPANAFGRPPFIPARAGRPGTSGSASLDPASTQAPDGAGPSTGIVLDAASPGAHQHTALLLAYALCILHLLANLLLYN